MEEKHICVRTRTRTDAYTICICAAKYNWLSEKLKWNMFVSGTFSRKYFGFEPILLLTVRMYHIFEEHTKQTSEQTNEERTFVWHDTGEYLKKIEFMKNRLQW